MDGCAVVDVDDGSSRHPAAMGAITHSATRSQGQERMIMDVEDLDGVRQRRV